MTLIVVLDGLSTRILIFVLFLNNLNSFFSGFNHDFDDDDLTVGQLEQCTEDQLLQIAEHYHIEVTD